jgi:hypothetical protein
MDHVDADFLHAERELRELELLPLALQAMYALAGNAEVDGVPVGVSTAAVAQFMQAEFGALEERAASIRLSQHALARATSISLISTLIGHHRPERDGAFPRMRVSDLAHQAGPANTARGMLRDNADAANESRAGTCRRAALLLPLLLRNTVLITRNENNAVQLSLAHDALDLDHALVLLQQRTHTLRHTIRDHALAQ